MAGKNGLDPHVEKSHIEESQLPVAMLTKSDASSLAYVISNKVTKGDGSLLLRLHMSSKESYLESNLFGDESYPKLRVSTSTIQVLGRKGWGVTLGMLLVIFKLWIVTLVLWVVKSEDKGEWQLFVMAEKEMTESEIGPLEVAASPKEWLQANGGARSSDLLTLSRDAEAYRAILYEQCSSKFDSSAGKLRLS